MIKKLSFNKKLILMSSILSVLLITVGCISYFSGRAVTGRYNSIVEKSVPELVLINDMFLTYRQTRIVLRSLAIPGMSKADSDVITKNAVHLIAEYEKLNSAYVSLESLTGQKELYEHMANTWSDFKRVAEQIIALSKKGTPEDQQKIISIFLDSKSESAEAFGKAIEELVAFHRKVIATKAAAAAEEATRSNQITWLVIALAVLLGLGVSLFTTLTTSRELKSITSGLIENVSEVSGTASDLSSSSAALSSAASTQASSIQETAASIEEIRSMVQRNSENTVESAKLSAQSKDEANIGKNSVNDMISAMEDITRSNDLIQKEVDAGNQRISEIVQIIQNIESKTNVINEIVFQTKLLSFNASVEAARAGEHGKGFAVVAEEVGNLANMSGTAAKEISVLLSQSTDRVHKIVEETTSRVKVLMDESALKLERGGQVAQTCREILERIVVNADGLSGMVESIASASQEQSAGVNEIGKAIQLLEEATNVNAQETNNTAASAQHLNGQVQALNQSIFRLKSLITGGNNGSGTIVNAFVWRDRYTLGVTTMDDEHKVLIEKINTLVKGINGGDKISLLTTYFDDLGSYTKEHFAHEESYMASISYPDLPNHKIIHKKLLEKVDEFGRKIHAGDLDAVTLVGFLNDWLIRHILGVDMRYAEFSRTRADPVGIHRTT